MDEQRKEVVIRLPAPAEPKGHLCPACGGQGTMSDGMASFGPTEIRIRPATPCRLCEGKGRVLVSPLDD